MIISHGWGKKKPYTELDKQVSEFIKGGKRVV